MKNALTIKRRAIRKERNQSKYRVILEYITAKGRKRLVSFLYDSRAEAENKMNFRLSGITQGHKIVGIE